MRSASGWFVTGRADRRPESRTITSTPLSDLGVVQARRLATPLGELSVDAILISPLRRAWQTWQHSQVVAGHVEFSSRLIESDWGIPDVALLGWQDAWLEGV